MTDRKIKNTESGIVLVTVLMMSVVMMILAIGIIETNVSSVLSGQKQIDRIKSDQMTRGAAWLRYSQYIANSADLATTTVTQNLDGKNYDVQDQDTGVGPVGVGYDFSNLRTRTFTVTY